MTSNVKQSKRAMAEISDCEFSVVTYRWTHGLFQHRFVEHPSVTQVLQIFRVSNNRMKMKKVLKETLTIRHTRLQLLQGKTRSAAAQNSRRPHFLNLEFRRTVVRKQTTGYSGIVHLFLLSLFWSEIILKGPLICRTPVALGISVSFLQHPLSLHLAIFNRKKKNEAKYQTLILISFF